MSISPSPSGRFYSPSGRISRITYAGRLVTLVLIIAAILTWGSDRSSIAGLILGASVALMVIQAVKRGRDAGCHWLIVPALFILNGIAFLLLAVWPSKAVQATPAAQ